MSDIKQAIADAIAGAIYAEYEEHGEWDEAKDLVENINTVNVAEFVLRVLSKFGAVDNIASMWQTAAMCEADRAKDAESKRDCYKVALMRIAMDEVPRVRVHKWREDGVSSKEDRCAHTKAMWEDCSECIAEFASIMLRGAPATRVERDGVWYVPLGPAKKDADGHSYSLDQLKPDEILVSPGWIYKREVPLVDMGGELP